MTESPEVRTPGNDEPYVVTSRASVKTLSKILFNRTYNQFRVEKARGGKVYTLKNYTTETDFDVVLVIKVPTRHLRRLDPSVAACVDKYQNETDWT